MERVIVEFIGGLFLVGIMPMIMGQLFNKAVLSKRLNYNIVFIMTLITVVIWSLINQNSDILIGAVIGSGLFQILVINGVNKLGIQEESIEKITFQNFWKRIKENHSITTQQNQIKYRSGGQYLIVSVIFLLFLCADYLLKGKYIRNVLNQVDGGILIILFITYLYLMREKAETGVFQKFLYAIKEKKKYQNTQEGSKISTGSNAEQGEKKRQFCMEIGIYVFIGIILFLGGFLLVNSITKIAVSFGISQYGIGLTLMAWCINISNILQDKISSGDKRGEGSDISHEMRFEEIMSNTIFSITLLLGIAVLIRPIFISTFMIYNLILFGIATLLVQLAEKIDNRLAGSSMATVYIGIIIYAFYTL